MNNPLDLSLRGLSDCGGCAGIEASTPVAITNRPGLAAISFRSGTHAQFKASLLAALTSRGRPGLTGLRTRAEDDFTIALLDGFSTLADVLTFYSERVAQEAYLRTATERRSVLELARAIGYELKPGVAASAWLAFTIEDAPGAPGYATIEKGAKVQSLPHPGETPQTFETIESLEARKEWNELNAQAVETEPRWFGRKQLHLAGLATNLKPGDALLLVGAEREQNAGNENWDFRRVQFVEPVPHPDPAKGHTVVTLDRPLGSVLPHVEPAKRDARVYALRTRASLFGHNAPDWRGMPISIQRAYGDPSRDSAPMALTEWPGFTLGEVTGIPAGGIGQGLLGEYYGTTRFRERRLGRLDAQVNFDWGTRHPDPRLGSDTFSVRWTGWIEPDVTGNYTFYTVSDDGVRLWIGGQLILENWTTHGADRKHPDTARVPVRLEAGKKYPVRLEYFEEGGAAVIELYWALGDNPKQLVPAARLFPADGRHLHLDGVYRDLVPGGWAVISNPEYQELYQILEAIEDNRTGFTLSAKCTRLTLSGEQLLERFNDGLRDVSVFAQSEWLPWAETPLRRPVQGTHIDLDRSVPGLAPNRRLIVRGRRSRARVIADGVVAQLPDRSRLELGKNTEVIVLLRPENWDDPDQAQPWQLQLADGTVVRLVAAPNAFELLPARNEDPWLIEQATLKKAIPSDTGRTTLELATALGHAYDPATARIAANVALATHGETVREILGNGDAAQVHQSFTLKQHPLTFTTAPTASGAESSLAVWVNEVRWQEVPSLYARDPRERVFIARQQDDGSTMVTFGDGRSGARLPGGQENVRAVFRKGAGLEGLVKANQLSLLLTRPLGLRSVTNPVASSGAEDPENLADARRNAPLQVLTLGRVVSLADYADFARAFSGIAKAHATWVWTPQGRGAFVTVAAPQGRPFPADTGTIRDLRRALLDFGNARIPVSVTASTITRFPLAGTLHVAREHVPERVKAAVDQALLARFNFDAGDFGQDIARSEILRIVQGVAGVVAVELTAPSTPILRANLPSAGDRLGATRPAGLLVLDEASLVNLKAVLL